MRSVLWSFFAAFIALVVAGSAMAQQGNYRIQPGDSLRVEVLEDSSLNRSVLVLPDGASAFRLRAPSALVAKRPASERAIATRIAPNFANPPTVFVAVVGIPPQVQQADTEETPDTILVYLVGEVANPGPKQIIAGSSVLQLLSQSGGFTPFAATKRLQLRRPLKNGQEKLYVINYKALSRGARFNRDLHLHEGDVILVPERRLFE